MRVDKGRTSDRERPKRSPGGSWFHVLIVIVSLTIVLVIPVSSPAWKMGKRANGTPQDDPKPKNSKRATPTAKTKPDLSLRDFDQNCFRSGCHGQTKEAPWLHGPVTVGACNACHIEQGPSEDHKFALSRPADKLCNHCHPQPKAQVSVHEAFSKGKCTSCHDPHGGANRFFIRPGGDAKLCGTCHQVEHRNGGKEAKPGPRLPQIHEPVEKGKCLECHRPHQSGHKRLLVRSEKDLCFTCHEKVHNELTTASWIHEPVGDRCTTCHSPHGSEHEKLLQDDARSLCSSCHGDLGARGALVRKFTDTPTGAAHARFQSPFDRDGFMVHGALDSERGCLECHTPHSAPRKSLLAKEPGPTCLSCHAKPITMGADRTIAGLEELLEKSKSVHEPVAKGNCQGCHDGHGSVWRSLLKSPFSESFYEPYARDRYALCFKCHESALAESKETTKTGFRQGVRNLHFVHVSREKGRNCGVCHAPHGSSQDSLINTAVPFGPAGWPLTIEFSKTDSGGRCASACHAEKTYDRLLEHSKKKGESRER